MDSKFWAHLDVTTRCFMPGFHMIATIATIVAVAAIAIAAKTKIERSIQFACPLK